MIEQAPAAARGVVAVAPVGRRLPATPRVFRYEVRCWRGGTIPDIAEAIESSRRWTTDPALARRVSTLGSHGRPGPRRAWRGGDVNSDAIVAWLLGTAWLPAASIDPSAGGRVPGWNAGLVIARRGQAPV